MEGAGAVAGIGIQGECCRGVTCGSGLRRSWRENKQTGRVKLGSRKRVNVSVRAVSSGAPPVEFEEGDPMGTAWSVDSPVAKIVTQLVAIEPIYKALKFGARTVMIRSAEQNGIPWKETVEQLRTSQVYSEKDLVENTELSYPDYYLKEFHGYENGNLSWQAAFEVEPAGLVLSKRTYPSAPVQEGFQLLRGRSVDAIFSHHTEFSNGQAVKAILDMGCSTGASSRFLADRFPEADVTGLDLSPYFLAVARHLEKETNVADAPRKTIQYIHGNAEHTGLPSQSFDLVSMAFVIHEFPRSVVPIVLREAHRLLRPGGTIALTDHSIKSKAVQELPSPLLAMMRSVEPWLHEFHLLNVEEEVEKCGFSNISSRLTSPRHFTLTATAV